MMTATAKQLAFLEKLGVTIEKELTIKEASILIAKTLKTQRTENTETIEKTTTKTSVFIKDIFEEFKQKYWKQHFAYYDEKKYNSSFKYILKLGEYYYHFETPGIETRFCFGFGQNGISSQEDEQIASDMSNYARTNEDYFIQENLKDLNQRINYLQEYLDKKICNHKMVIEKTYEDTKIVFYEIAELMNNEYYSMCWGGGHKITDYVVRELSDEEVQTLIDAFKEIKADFEKRLKTYLKKYGLSKINTWTYLVD